MSVIPEKGEKRGIEIGEKRGETTLLRHQLAKRFGKLPIWVEVHLEQATINELEQ